MFKVGDLVRLKANEGNRTHVKKGEVRKVAKVHLDWDGERIVLEGMDALHDGYFAKRFELVEQAPAVRYIRGDVYPPGGYKVGDLVFINPERLVSGVYIDKFKHDVPYTIKRIEGDAWDLRDSLLYFEEGAPRQGVMQKRFLPAIPDLSIRIGDKVVVDGDAIINKRDPILAIDGKVYTVKSGTKFVTLDEIPGMRFSIKRFKLFGVGVAVPKVELPKEEKKVVLPDLREVLTEEVKRRGQGTICSYGTLFEDGKINNQVNDVCHARLTWKPRDSKQEAKLHSAALIICQSDKILKRQGAAKYVEPLMEMYKKYVSYLLNESPWAVTFLTKDVDEAFEKGILMNVDVHRNWVCGGAVVIREGVEFPYRLPVFNKVLEMGFNGNVAYLCSMYLTGSLDSNTYTEGDCGGGHQALSKFLTWDAVKQFFAKGYKADDKLKSFREEQGYYYIAKAAIEGYGGQVHWEVKPDSLGAIFNANCPKQTVGEGFLAKTTITEEGLKALATFINNEIEGAK